MRYDDVKLLQAFLRTLPPELGGAKVRRQLTDAVHRELATHEVRRAQMRAMHHSGLGWRRGHPRRPIDLPEGAS